MILTRKQREALKKIYDRGPLPITYLQFRRTVQYAYHMDCAMVPWQGMWLGIEADGYTHS